MKKISSMDPWPTFISAAVSNAEIEEEEEEEGSSSESTNGSIPPECGMKVTTMSAQSVVESRSGEK
jgi:hypothetical protein